MAAVLEATDNVYPFLTGKQNIEYFLGIIIPVTVSMFIVFILTTVGVFGFTLLLVGLTLKYTKTASFDTILSYALLFLTGAILPKEQMPSWAQRIGEILPITKGINLSNRLMNGEFVRLMDYAQLTIQSVIFVLVGYGLFKMIYLSSKQSGIERNY